MAHFTPTAALIGGSMIGVATVAYLLTTGRYAGISGMLRSVAFPGDPDRRLDSLFVFGLLVGGSLWLLHDHNATASSGPALGLVAAGGVFVGYGTALGNGCTSGHGVCGLGRLSIRSLTAVCTFLVAGAATVFVIRHVIGWS